MGLGKGPGGRARQGQVTQPMEVKGTLFPSRWYGNPGQTQGVGPHYKVEGEAVHKVRSPSEA